MHAQAIAGLGLFQGDGIVQVLGVCAVDGEDRGITQVKALVVFFLGNGCIRQLVCLGDDLFREVDVYATHRQHSVRTDAGTGADTKAEYDLYPVFRMAAATVYYLSQDLFALVVDDAVLALNLDGRLGHGVRTEQQSAVVVHDHAGQLAVCLFQDRQDFALRLAAPGGNIANEDTVLGHCALEELSGDEHILCVLFFGACKAEGTAQTDDGRRIIAHVCGRDIATPPLTDRTLFAQFLDCLPEVGCAATVGTALGRQVTVAHRGASAFFQNGHDFFAVAVNCLSAAQLGICHK